MKTSRWTLHVIVLVLLALVPVPFLAHLVDLPARVGADPLPLAIFYWMGLITHAFLSSLGVAFLRPGLLGTLGVHAGLLSLVGAMVALVLPR